MARHEVLRIALALIGSIAPIATAVAQEEIKPFSKRIIGCEKTEIEKHPWQVAINVTFPDRKSYLCGGSIIAKHWVLTAAHCFHPRGKPGDGRVKSGVTDIVTDGSWAKIERIVQHENYNPHTLENDVALVKLRTAPKGRVIPLSAKRLNMSDGQPLEITGWGITEKGEPSETLCKTTVPYVDNAKCNEPDIYNGNIGSGMMCAGYEISEQKDSCGGDSGGPLVWHSPEGPILVGVVSWGEGCAKDYKPGVYTRVSAYRDWIASVLANSRGAAGSPEATGTSGTEVNSSVQRLKDLAKELFSPELANDIQDQIEQEARSAIVQSGRVYGPKSVATLFLADRLYERLEVGAFEGTPVVRWNGFDRGNNRPTFIHLPQQHGSFAYRSASGRTITPQTMDTDGGSIPLALHSVLKFSPWRYGPAYIIHDWIFVSHECKLDPDLDITFNGSAEILAESLKTLMEVGFVDFDGVKRTFPKAEDTLYLIYKAVQSDMARKVWDDTQTVTCR